MSEVIIFAGTTEGRVLAEYCRELGIRASVSVVSRYGTDLLPEDPLLCARTGPLDRRQMEEYLKQEKAKLVFDATHPYAREASANIAAACEELGLRCVRVARGRSEGCGENQTFLSCAREAAEYLNQTNGNIMVTTGSKELEAFSSVRRWKERGYARVLPTAEAIEACRASGLSGSHILAIQGPFSREMNIAMFRHVDADYLVTKESGREGGYEEKLKAAQVCGLETVVIGRPEEQPGISVEAARAMLEGLSGKEKIKKLYLIGIGMGGPQQMTLEAKGAVSRCQAVLGALRMLRSADLVIPPQAIKENVYLSRDVSRWLSEHRELDVVGLLYSGDTGFYSGAAKVMEWAEEGGRALGYDLEVIPGISTLSALCARLKTTWENVYPISVHGREADIIGEVKRHDRTFILLGGRQGADSLCRTLCSGGMGDFIVSVGENLSCRDERIKRGTARELCGESFQGLCAALVEKPRRHTKEEQGER